MNDTTIFLFFWLLSGLSFTLLLVGVYGLFRHFGVFSERQN